MIEITIPILNEEDTLYDNIKLVIKYIKNNLSEYQPISIILADNGSTDKTQDIAIKLSNEFKNVKYIRLNQRGVGRALKKSWTQSNADIIGYMDLDLATDLKYLKHAFDILINDKADILSGSRLKTGANVIGRTALRSFTSKAFNLIVKLIFNTSHSDGMCGFKFLQKNIFNNLLNTGAQSDGWFFSTELLITSEYLGYRVYDLPVTWTDDQNSKVKIIKLAIEYLKAMIILHNKLSKIKNHHAIS